MVSKDQNNPFKKLEEQELPSGLQSQVMDSINMIDLMSNVADLFTGKMADSVVGMLRINERQDQKSDSNNGIQ